MHFVTVTTSDDHMASLQVFFENIVVDPTSEMDVVVFGYRPNKDFYLTFHNKTKKKHAESALSACFYIAIEFKLEKGILL